MDKALAFNKAVLAALLWNDATKKYNKYEYFKGGTEIKL